MSFRTESELLACCRRGDAEAWDDLFDRYYAATARFIFQLDGQLTREDTQEICQETFLAVIRNLETFAGESQFQTWLFRIASNRTRDFRERRNALKRGGGKAEISLQAENPETGATLDPPSPAPEPDQALFTAEDATLIHRALDQLGEPCREIIELRYFADLSYEEISRTLHLNVKTVSSRLSKCLDRLEAIARRIFAGGKTAVLPSNLT